MQKFFTILVGLTYSFLFKIILNIFYLLAPNKIKKKLSKQLKGRNFSQSQLLELATKCKEFDKKVLFFCSSAGEFEQALPLINAFKEKNILSVVFLFSQSGINYFESKKDRTDYKVAVYLSPLDDVRTWADVFSAVQPMYSIVVRHELWPGFLWTAGQWGKVYLVDATIRQFRGIQNKFLMRFCDKIFTVEDLQASCNKSVATGDTKYDRVKERFMQEKKTKSFLPVFKNYGVFGSVYKQDLEIIADSLREGLGRDWGFYIFPHELDFDSLGFWRAYLTSQGIIFESFSNLENFPNSECTSAQVVLVDKQGVLAEAYIDACFAYVGGAVHSRVHNILEPLMAEIPVFFGPHFESSPEAVAAINHSVAFSVKTSEQFRDGLKKSISNLEIKNKIKQFLAQRCGATKKIIDHITI